ncbi:putative disease resistance protein [Camellia lanceoleosa]|nr:putative disease resistance protein [Camellia lanceoleosa]
MAESVVLFAGKWISNLLIQEAKSLYGVRNQVEDLVRELRRMQCILKDADAKQVKDEIIHNLVTEIREIAYDVEDMIATFIVEIVTMIDDQLVKLLYQVQQEKKCLVVLDDIWSSHAWKCLSPAFPKGNPKGSKIIVTTRNKEVVTSMDPGGFVLEPECLCPDESWKLFEKKAFSKTNTTGNEMVCSAHGFPHLKSLILCNLKIEEWRVDDGAMPKLSYLGIEGCKKLKMLPNGLRFIPTLQELQIFSMSKAFNDRLRVVDSQEGEDFHKISHIPSICLLGEEFYEDEGIVVREALVSVEAEGLRFALSMNVISMVDMACIQTDLRLVNGIEGNAVWEVLVTVGINSMHRTSVDTEVNGIEGNAVWKVLVTAEDLAADGSWF